MKFYEIIKKNNEYLHYIIFVINLQTKLIYKQQRLYKCWAQLTIIYHSAFYIF